MFFFLKFGLVSIRHFALVSKYSTGAYYIQFSTDVVAWYIMLPRLKFETLV